MKRVLRWVLRIVALLVVAGLLVVFLPIMHPPFAHKSGPAPTYEEAVKEIKASIAATPSTVSAAGMPRLMEHGQQTEYVFVFMHGLSNCPEQFVPLGRLFYERGHNVYIPRLPYHGETNRLTTDWARLTAQDMVTYGSEAADVARGLGKKVVMVGLSVNGATAGWLAQNRSDLHRVALLSPFLAPAGMPNWVLAPVQHVLLRMPNLFIWWNPVLKEKNPGPPYAYPRFPTRVIGQTMLLGETIINESGKAAPASKSILVVTTAVDRAANNAVTQRLVENWRKNQPVETFEFPAEQKVPHDFIDPNQPDEQTAISYPKLIELLEK